MDRDLDDVYFHVQRDGKWDCVCFSDLTNEEMNLVLSNKENDWLKSLCITLGRTIRRIGNQFDLVGDD